MSKDNNDNDTQWLVKALQALGHKNPSQWKNVCHDDSQLVPMTLWLEDRIIRQRKLKQRQELRNDFWQHVDDYLIELNIPLAYLGNKKEGISWRHEKPLRSRVIHWLFSIATLELYGDRFIVNKDTTTAPSSNTNSLEALDNSTSFPLGFSTGDESVDRILTVLRMNLLLDLEREQQVINESIAQLQQQTIQHAKPLKQQGRRRK